MKRFMTNTFTLGFIIFLVFRLIWLLAMGANKDGNFLILTIIPLAFSILLIYLLKIIYHHTKRASH